MGLYYSRQNQTTIQRLQNRAARIITGNYYINTRGRVGKYFEMDVHLTKAISVYAGIIV